MNGQNQENLKELFERFFSPEEAARALQDVQKGEQILRQNPAPEPDRQLIAAIKYDVGQALAARRDAWTLWTVAYRVAVAATIIIAVAIGTKLFQKGGPTTQGPQYAHIIPRAIWESDDITADDADLSVLTAEVRQIEDEMLGLQSGGRRSNGDNLIVELEVQFIEIGSDFWKG